MSKQKPSQAKSARPMEPPSPRTALENLTLVDADALTAVSASSRSSRPSSSAWWGTCCARSAATSWPRRGVVTSAVLRWTAAIAGATPWRSWWTPSGRRAPTPPTGAPPNRHTMTSSLTSRPASTRRATAPRKPVASSAARRRCWPTSPRGTGGRAPPTSALRSRSTWNSARASTSLMSSTSTAP